MLFFQITQQIFLKYILSPKQKNIFILQPIRNTITSFPISIYQIEVLLQFFFNKQLCLS